jgi:hypothetical protein
MQGRIFRGQFSSIRAKYRLLRRHVPSVLLTMLACKADLSTYFLLQGLVSTWLPVCVRSRTMLIALLSVIVILIGTFVCDPSFIVTVAVPLNVIEFSALYLIWIPVIVKSDILCSCIAVPLINVMLNEASSVEAVIFSALPDLLWKT